jgi:hypothetical protein
VSAPFAETEQAIVPTLPELEKIFITVVTARSLATSDTETKLPTYLDDWSISAIDMFVNLRATQFHLGA